MVSNIRLSNVLLDLNRPGEVIEIIPKLSPIIGLELLSIGGVMRLRLWGILNPLKKIG